MKKPMFKRSAVSLATVTAVLSTLFAGGGVSDALAAQMNGMPLGDTITNETIVGPNTPNSGKFLIGQGKLDIQTDASVGNTLGKLQSPLPDGTMGKLNAILDALAPTKDNAPLVGVVGGEGHFDANTAGF